MKRHQQGKGSRGGAKQDGCKVEDECGPPILRSPWLLGATSKALPSGGLLAAVVCNFFSLTKGYHSTVWVPGPVPSDLDVGCGWGVQGMASVAAQDPRLVYVCGGQRRVAFGMRLTRGGGQALEPEHQEV